MQRPATGMPAMLAVAWGLAAVSGVMAQTGSLPAEDVAAIEQLLSQRADLVQARDWAPWWEIYEEDALFVPPEGSPALLADWAAVYEPSDFKVEEFTGRVEEIDGRGHLAFLRASNVEVTRPEGVEPDSLTGTFVWLVRKRPDG